MRTIHHVAYFLGTNCDPLLNFGTSEARHLYLILQHFEVDVYIPAMSSF